MNRIGLVALDVDGVLRDASRLFYECHKSGLEVAGMGGELARHLGVKEVWHFKGLGQYNNKRDALSALYVLAKAGRLGEIPKILQEPDAERRIAGIMDSSGIDVDNSLLDRMVEKYVDVAVAEDSKGLVRVYPDVQKNMERLRGSGKKIAIFTNSQRVTIDRDLGEMESMFVKIVTLKDVGSPKPSGEGLGKISKASGVGLNEMIYVGDTVVDIRAARDAGCRSAVVLSGMGLRQHLEMERPDFMFKDLGDACSWLSSN